MQRHTADTDIFLRAFTKGRGATDAVLLRVGLGVSLTSVAFALAGVHVLDTAADHLLAVILGGIATAYFLLRLLTVNHPWSGKIGCVAGWMLLTALPCAYIVAESSAWHPAVGASSWVPAQLIAILIAFSALRLRVWQPMFVSVCAAVWYGLAFAYVRAHAPLEIAVSQELAWNVGFFRSGTMIAWGGLASLLVIGLRSLVSRAGKVARASELLGKYRLGDVLGRGGMGEVSRATYCPEGGFVSEVAIKRIHANLVEEPGMIERFREEAEVGARLRHHNVVATLDFGRMEDTYFLAMEYVDGESLRRLLRRADHARRVVPERLAAFVAQEILAGLEYAHDVARCPRGERLRVVHRDLCPNNILVSRSGHVKVADFGVAHAIRDAACYEPSQIVGKVGYLSPEAVRGGSLDERADLFAVGCILWELLTGERAFKRDDDVITSLKALLECDLSAAPGYSWLNKRWLAFFERALAPRPEDRFGTAAEMSAAVANLVPTPLAANELAIWIRSLERPSAEATPSDITAPVLSPVLDHTPVPVRMLARA
jgi:serine/threonine protein kinase